MTVPGHIENGQVVLDSLLNVPNGTRVVISVEIRDKKGAGANGAQVEASHPTLAERFGNIMGVIDDLPEDMAENHDHYLHGTPKR